MIHPTVPDAARKLVKFLHASPTPFHAVQNAAHLLEKEAKFIKIKETDDWEDKVVAGGKYYFTRNQTALVAFTIPPKWKKGDGVSIVATHIDSPNLRVRPISKRTRSGYLQVGIETYGGGIWHTWFDRDLSLAGRVVVADKAGSFVSRLIKIERPLLRIPSLAIHLDRAVNDNFKFNQETEFVPILGQVADQLNASSEPPKPAEEKGSVPKTSVTSAQDNHDPALLALLSEELSVGAEEIHDFELHLYDTQQPTLGGLHNEFVFSPRLDNQFSSFCAVAALASHAADDGFSELEGNVNCIALFNHEEIGSVSTTGAESSLIPSLLQRLSPTVDSHAQSIARSFIISADMGHAVHPNYPSKHEENHRPVMNGGMVIKTNAKQRYASDAIGSFLVKRLVEAKGGKVQEFEVRNDMSCGSTVGPMLSKIGVRTVDVGNASLSMHSIRETAGSHDVQSAIDLFSSFFEGYAKIRAELQMD